MLEPLVQAYNYQRFLSDWLYFPPCI